MLTDTAILVLCSAGYFFSWRFQSRDNYRAAILLLVFCGMVLRVFVSSDLFLHEWDERFHALVAKNMIHHPFRPTLYDDPVLPYDFRNWAGNHVWLHKQPLALWTMALSMRLFGVNEMALRIPSILLSTLGIWITFSIGRHLYSKKVGYLAAFLFSVNGLVIELTGGRVATDHIDIFFLFFIELSILFSIRFALHKSIVWNLLAGLALGAAILTKWLPALIVLPVWLLLMTGPGRCKPGHLLLHGSILLVSAIAVFLPWQIHIHGQFPAEAAWEAKFNLMHLTEVIEGRSGSAGYYLNRIRINYGELIYLPLGWFLWKAAKDPRDFRRLAVSVWFLLPFLFFTLVKTKMQAYILFTSPALFLMTAEFILMLRGSVKGRRLKWLYWTVMVLLIALPVRYSIERVKPFSGAGREPEWVSGLKEVDSRGIENGVLFNYPHYIEAMFYTELTVYENLPGKEVLGDLVSRGYTVLINDHGRLPEEIETMGGISIVTLAVKP